MSRTVSALVRGSLVAAGLALAGAPANAWQVPSPCDFVTSGGFVYTDSGAKANFGAHGGCKLGDFWGHVNYVDHGAIPFPYHVDSTQITGYLDVPGEPNGREICGFATTNLEETVRFRVRLVDNGEPGTNDMFGIRLSNGYVVTTRVLGGGNVQLHKPNPSNTGPNPPPDETQMCGGLASP